MSNGERYVRGEWAIAAVIWCAILGLSVGVSLGGWRLMDLSPMAATQLGILTALLCLMLLGLILVVMVSCLFFAMLVGLSITLVQDQRVSRAEQPAASAEVGVAGSTDLEYALDVLTGGVHREAVDECGSSLDFARVCADSGCNCDDSSEPGVWETWCLGCQGYVALRVAGGLALEDAESECARLRRAASDPGGVD